ncbi:MAG: pilus assembly protein [Nevskia sp.]|nr:pilus assembly protein [Nevskia sp.]
MKPITLRRSLPRKLESGAAAIEFAIIFPIMLAVAYAGLVYAYIYLLQQSINFAAQQGVQAAVAVPPSSNPTADVQSRLAQAELVRKGTLNWLPSDQAGRITAQSPATCPGAPAPGSNTFVYQISFAVSGGSNTALFPSLVNLPGVGTVPPLPTTLIACAVGYT